MFVIDIHAHFVPRDFRQAPVGAALSEWPVMEASEDGHLRMMIGGKPFRVFESAYWDVADRIAHMDGQGIDVQVLSPLPELLGYWFSAPTGAAIAAHMHKEIAAAVERAPARLVGLGMLPLQDIQLSVDMVPGIAEAGLRGVIVASNVNGVSIADARFDPVFGALEARDLAVFVHGYRPAGVERLLGSPLLSSVVGVPQDTASALASFMMTDIFGRFPKLKLGFAHGGGTLGAVLERLDHVWHEFAEMRDVLKLPPREYIKKFFFDTVTFGTAYLAYLIDVIGPETLMAGTDGPTAIGQRGLKNFVMQACRGDAVAVELILSQNARRVLGIRQDIAPKMMDA